MKKQEQGRTFMQTIGISTIIVGVIMFIISLSFFVLLSVIVTPSSAPPGIDTSFGMQEIIFSIAFAVITALFLFWLKSMIEKNTYLGLIIGLLALAAFEYALFFRYSGPYTTFFATVAGIVVLLYLAIHFFKSRKLEKRR